MKTWVVSAVMLSCISLEAAWATSFRGPLERPALQQVERAQAGRMVAVASQGRHVVAVGERGYILVSHDGGQSWLQAENPTSSDLVGVFLASPELGWAVGHEGVILHTADAGRSWVRQFDGRDLQARVADYLADQPQLDEMQRMDLERLAEEGADKPLLAVRFVNARLGQAVGAFGLALETRDGGQHWQPINGRLDNPMGYHLYAVAHIEGETWVAGEKGLLLRQPDSAERFETVALPYAGTLFGVLGQGEWRVVHGLQGSFWVSPDRGRSWREVDLGVSDSLTAAAFLSVGTVLVATQGGRVLEVDLVTGEHRRRALPGSMSWADVTVTDEGQIILAGHQGLRSLPAGP